jgi:hypothetical protein
VVKLTSFLYSKHKDALKLNLYGKHVEYVYCSCVLFGAIMF